MAYVIDEKNLERQLLLAQILEPYTLQALQPLALKPGSRILDIGCGLGETTRLLAASFPGCEVIGLDQDAILLETAGYKKSPTSSVTHFVKGDAAALSFADVSFDLVFCRYVLVHLPDPLKAL